MSSAAITIPRKLPLLVTTEVLLPGSTLRIPVTSSRNMSMVKSRLLGHSTLSSIIIGILPKEPGHDADNVYDLSSLHPIGTAAVVVQVTGTSWPQPSYTLLVSGLCRFKLDKLVQEVPYPVGVVTQLDKFSLDEENEESNTELSTLIANFKGEVSRMLEMLDVSVPTVAKLKQLLYSLPGHRLADLSASVLKTSYEEKLQILDTIDITERFKKMLPLLTRQVEGLQLLKEAKKNALKPASETMPFNRIVRFPRGLGGNDDEANDLQDLQRKLEGAELPPQAKKVAFKELNRLKRMGPFSPEHSIIRNYLELIADLPWSKSSSEIIDIQKARKDLDADHYAMDKLKRRVLEYLAVRQLKNSLKGPILCFVGPPGVGKTSVGRSIAQTLGREFHRISLGGVCNQSDIRGHRRTYIGSMPGRIIQGLKTVAVNNPVFLLDEIDKLATSVHGDPGAALLEVLDPEQNCNFMDHYLNVPFDLSQVMFIATANTTQSIPPALLDRMEVIHVPGYSQEEKFYIALQHLIPKQLQEHGLTSDVIDLPSESIKMLISRYTREAGVRTLERKIGALCRAVAVKVAEKKFGNSSGNMEMEQDKGLLEITALASVHDFPILLDEAALEDILGPAIFDNEISGKLEQSGVAIGLAWTAVGGQMMFVEVSKMRGTGELVLTGQLGNVMKESAKLAVNWVRTHAAEYGIEIKEDLMSKTDVHIHFPAGAVGKDGPSAGVTIVTALMSLLADKPVAADIAMTGEITLRGVVLPVGGIKEKVLAGHRAGIKRIALPKKNQKDLQEVPENVKKEMTFIFVSHVDEVLQAAFEEGLPVRERETIASKL